MFGDGCLAPPGHNKLKTASSSINRIYWQKKKKVFFRFFLHCFFLCVCVKKNVFVCVFLFCCVLETPHHRPPSQLQEKVAQLSIKEKKSM